MSAIAAGKHLPTKTKTVSVEDLQRSKAATQMQKIYSDFRQQLALHTFTGAGLVRLLHKTKKRIRNEVMPMDAAYAKEAMAKLDEAKEKARATVMPPKVVV